MNGLSEKTNPLILFLVVILAMAVYGKQRKRHDEGENNNMVNHSKDYQIEYDRSKHISYSFSFRNPTNRLIEEFEFMTLAPIERSAGQLCCTELRVSYPYVQHSDQYGHHILKVQVPEIPPYSNRSLNVRVSMKTSPRPISTEANRSAEYLETGRMLSMGDENVIGLARTLRRESPEMTASAIYEWLTENIYYSGYSSRERDAAYTIRERRGDCTEYMYLAMALARLNGIPARGVSGYILEPGSAFEADGLHNWAEVLIDGVWEILDAQEKNFRQGYGEYIAFQIADGDGGNKAFSGNRYQLDNADIMVVMN